MRFERRLDQPRWLSVAVPIGSMVVAFALMAVVLLATGHNPLSTYERLFDSAFFADGALTSTPLFRGDEFYIMTEGGTLYAFRPISP